MNIGIIGTRGIPNHYGGFEQFAEYLAKILVDKGHSVTVYNSHNHPYQDTEWQGVSIIHKNDPENKIGTAGQFLYDLTCILDTRQRKFDIVLQLGYTSSSIWGMFLPKSAIVITNMDGLEWKRSKYGSLVRRFLLVAEKLGVKFSDYLIADSIGIQEYLKCKYQTESSYIPYGANLIENYSKETLYEFNLTPYYYNMLIARLEPENSIEIILDGIVQSNHDEDFIVIGNHMTNYGDYLKKKYSRIKNIKFIGGLYDINKLNNLRYYSRLYFHGHTVGGTNPSLLEAMGSGAYICANDNLFNKSILGNDALYFKTSLEIAIHIQDFSNDNRIPFVNNNFSKIRHLYSWSSIVGQYEELFLKAIHKKKSTGRNGHH